MSDVQFFTNVLVILVLSVICDTLGASEDVESTSQIFPSISKCINGQLHFGEDKNVTLLLPPHFVWNSSKSANVNGTKVTLTFTSIDLSCPSGEIETIGIPMRKESSTNRLTFQPIEGMLRINSGYYNNDQYCILRWHVQEEVVVRHCKVKCGDGRKGTHLCVPRCCPLNTIGKGVDPFICEPQYGNPTWTPFVYSSSDFDKRVSIDWSVFHFQRYPHDKGAVAHVYKRPHSLLPEEKTVEMIMANGNVSTIEEEMQLLEYEEEEGHAETKFKLLDNGSFLYLNWKKTINGNPCKMTPMSDDDSRSSPELLKAPVWNVGKLLELGCVAPFQIRDEPFEGREDEQIAFILTGNRDGNKNNHAELKAWVTLFSMVFLVLTLVMYIMIWGKHNIHGWTIFSFTLSMFFFFLTLEILHFTHVSGDEDLLKTNFCPTIAILNHFFFLCTVCWMSVINFDLWATFRNLSPSQEKNKSLIRYIAYATFALGIPVVIVGVSIFLHFFYRNEYHEFTRESLPGYGISKSCTLSNCSKKYYLYTPMAILLCFNLVMFTWTIVTLWRYKQKTRAAAATGSQGQKQSWLLFCKMFMVMGVTWVMEVLSGFFDWDIIFFDIVNVLQAFFIFLIFAAKRENLLWIYRNYPSTRKIVGPVLRHKPCHAVEMDIEQTEMTSAEKNRTLPVAFRARLSSSSVQVPSRFSSS